MSETRKKISRFEQLRERAAATGKPSVTDNYVLGVDDGFDPPIVIAKPDLDKQETLFYLNRGGDAFGLLREFVGNDDYDRIKAAIKDDPHADALLVEIVKDITDHFAGKGASDVPGGSKAS
ncbi:hypothetical protein G4X40_20155 [Rhodococcus sp. D2-41]|uniref:hypothetical protein n=1 Tax=Speluncibacter jeojiensis TaxID=2710754 RepID=UPI0024108E54|nr:hypothetical protein [Rhodococcus sp. D2-41]MDG3012456.1 hypothetical protein [Rhodococcus sp. D2-41]